MTMNETKVSTGVSAQRWTRLRGRVSTATAMLALACVALPAAAAPPRQGIGRLTGTWQVVGVRVADSPVQALAKNDPAYMGAVLQVTPARLSWRRHGSESSLSAVCERPRLTARATIVCRAGDFGPPGGKTVLANGRLSVDWYDGGTLLLKRVR